MKEEIGIRYRPTDDDDRTPRERRYLYIIYRICMGIYHRVSIYQYIPTCYCTGCSPVYNNIKIRTDFNKTFQRSSIVLYKKNLSHYYFNSIK